MAAWPAKAVRAVAGRDDLYVQIGAFLADHGLSPEPAHYTFAHAVLSQPGSALAERVDRLVDGGVRLTGADVAALGGEVRAGAPVRLAAAPKVDDDAPGEADLLLARAQHQVGGLADTVRAIHAETQGFGRDLVAGAAALAASAGGIEEVAALTAAMIARVNDAEVRLADATREADELRTALDEARGSARTDPLTGLPNRRALDEAMAALAGAVATPIAICDVDHFKQVNDRFGHAAGDRVLRAIAHTLADTCEGHFVARYGGEELVVLMPGAAPCEAAALLDAARERIGARRLRLRDTDALIGNVTVSIGVALASGNGDAVAALARADAALYRAKAEGRDRLRAAPEIGG